MDGQHMNGGPKYLVKDGRRRTSVPAFIDCHFPGSQSLSFNAMNTCMKFAKLSRPFSYDFLVRSLTKIRFQIGAIISQFDAAL